MVMTMIVLAGGRGGQMTTAVALADFGAFYERTYARA
jgi:hypothetical protein